MAKRSSNRRARKAPKASSAVGMASAALANPIVQDLIREHSPEVIDAAKEWAEEAGGWIADQGDKFGQKGLELRAARVRTTIGGLSDGSRELADSFRPVFKALDKVDKLLKVAAALPFVARRRAHKKIDSRLDDLEAGLFEAVLQDPPSS